MDLYRFLTRGPKNRFSTDIFSVEPKCNNVRCVVWYSLERWVICHMQSHMNARATWSHGGTAKQNGGGTAVVWTTQDNFEVVLEILKRVRSTETVAAWICNETCNTIARIRYVCEADGAVRHAHKQRSWKPCTATSPVSSAMVFEQFAWSPQKSAKQCALWEWGILLSTRWRTITLPSSHPTLPRRNPTRSMDRTEM